MKMKLKYAIYVIRADIASILLQDLKYDKNSLISFTSTKKNLFNCTTTLTKSHCIEIKRFLLNKIVKQVIVNDKKPKYRIKNIESNLLDRQNNYKNYIIFYRGKSL